MFRKTHPEISVPPLGACGYPQHFIEALTRLEEQARQGKQAALVLLSIDNLAMIMSGYSMAVAEAVMSEIHEVVRAISPAATVLRIQRDQFGVLILNKSEAEASRWCEEAGHAIRAYSYSSRYGELHCLYSTAQQMIPTVGAHVEELLGRALVMLTEREADETTKNDISGAGRREEMGMANYLGQAVQENRLRLAYQPVIESATGKIVHYEALLRLYGEDGQISSAGALIPIAERMGFIPTIDKLVLTKVIGELRNDANVQLAVNVSNRTTLDPSWMALLKAELEKTPDIAPRLIVEITETAMHHDLKHMAYFCAEVQSTGCLIALDDFGSGYTSFRQLKTLSVDYVKIDGSFIKDLTDNADSRFFVKTLLDFTRGFGLKSVAECVETGDIAKMLMELGVDYLQGYYFGKPLNHRKWLNEGEYSSQ